MHPNWRARRLLDRTFAARARLARRSAAFGQLDSERRPRHAARHEGDRSVVCIHDSARQRESETVAPRAPCHHRFEYARGHRFGDPGTVVGHFDDDTPRLSAGSRCDDGGPRRARLNCIFVQDAEEAYEEPRAASNAKLARLDDILPGGHAGEVGTRRRQQFGKKCIVFIERIAACEGENVVDDPVRHACASADAGDVHLRGVRVSLAELHADDIRTRRNDLERVLQFVGNLCGDLAERRKSIARRKRVRHFSGSPCDHPQKLIGPARAAKRPATRLAVAPTDPNAPQVEADVVRYAVGLWPRKETA